MTGSDETSVTCAVCGADVQLVRRSNSLFLVCSCDHLEIDVSDAVGKNALFEPFGGNWSNIDE